MSKLALLGGSPVRTKPFPNSVTTGEEEILAAVEALKTGLLSGFIGGPGPEFLGGPAVLALEAAWCEKFKVPFAVSCNSATSALLMAVGACQIGPGDEVIVSPYTMSATATAILFYGGIPIFADIEPDCFCLDPRSIRQRITPRTRAILTTDIHGQPSEMDTILAIAHEHGLRVIVDCAQAPGAMYKESFAGTMADIGIYSLNRHKNIQCGEGGIAVCRDQELALRLQLIRNHGENVAGAEGYPVSNLVNTLGLNLRMTEVEAAIAHEQLKKMDGLNNQRIAMEAFLRDKLRDMPGLTMPAIRDGATHVFYMQAILYDRAALGIARETFTRALNAEGIPIRGGYVNPIYLAPHYQQKVAIGNKSFPFSGPHYDGQVDYRKGLCPVAENLYEERTLINPFLYPPLNFHDMQDIVDGIHKVIENHAELA